MFSWADFLALAKELVNRPDEASKRSAVSRAYYAVFCSARDFVERRLGISAKQKAEALNTGVHKYVWEALGGIDGGDHADLGDIGKGILRNRLKADYDTDVARLDQLCATEVVRASMLMDGLQTLLKPK